jgi:ABC-type Mn2+/Zn2+ transport system permease subunit
MSGAEFVPLSLTPMLIGIFAAVACALPGNFLLLRRQALIGDAISHVILPGIVVAFLVTGAVSTGPMMLGAAGAALVAVVLIEAVKRLGRIESGAAMGVIFTAMFAGGVLLLERSDTSSVHLDVEHALMGNLESLIWLDATGWSSLLDAEALAGLPPELGRIFLTLVVVALYTWVLWRPLKISTFDEGFARVSGLPVTVRRGGVDHRDRDVHLPARRRTADDRQPRTAGRVVGRLRRPLGGDRLCPRGLRAALARLRRLGERGGHDRHRLRRDPRPGRALRPGPPPQRRARRGLRAARDCARPSRC